MRLSDELGTVNGHEVTINLQLTFRQAERLFGVGTYESSRDDVRQLIYQELRNSFDNGEFRASYFDDVVDRIFFGIKTLLAQAVESESVQ